VSVLSLLFPPSDEDRAEGMAAEVADILAEPGTPQAHRLRWLQRTRQQILTDLAAEAPQPPGWPMEVA
jgi:hypothetical protein